MMSDLSVVGLPLRVGDKFVPRLSLRRIYNMKCFRPERYQHEVANHYRDFKLQQALLPPPHDRHLPHSSQRQRLRLPRQRRARSRQRPLAPIATTHPAQCRGELPIHVHYLPRFGDTAIGIGIGSSNPTKEETYNDTVRRIRSARSCEELKVLVHRQLN